MSREALARAMGRFDYGDHEDEVEWEGRLAEVDYLLNTGLIVLTAPNPAPLPAAETGVRLRISLTPDALDGGYTAEALDLPGCVSDGATAQEAVTNLLGAAEAVIATRGEASLPAEHPAPAGKDQPTRRRTLRRVGPGGWRQA